MMRSQPPYSSLSQGIAGAIAEPRTQPRVVDDAQPAAILAALPRHRRCDCGAARAAARRRSTSPCAQPPQPS
eukprot:8475325-Heterocapsa_arctica.AAC.1